MILKDRTEKDGPGSILIEKRGEQQCSTPEQSRTRRPTTDREVDPNTALTEYAIRTLVRTGRVPSIRIGKKYLVTIEALEEYLTGGETHKPAEPPVRGWRLR